MQYEPNIYILEHETKYNSPVYEKPSKEDFGVDTNSDRPENELKNLAYYPPEKVHLDKDDE